MAQAIKALKPDPNSLDREKALHMAKLAEQAERYEEMVAYMNRIVDLGIPANQLTTEERNLLSVGYKNMMSVRRTAYRTIKSLLESEPENALFEEYSNTVSEEVFDLITQVGEKIVDKYVDGPNKPTPNPNNDQEQEQKDTEVIVFFKKMAGDYNRYGAEITEGDPEKKRVYRENAEAAYKFAQDKAKALPSTNPIRLGLALNYSVFHYEICGQHREASALAKEAFDTAIDHLDTLGDDEYKDSTLIMQLLKDNLTLWNTDSEEDGDGNDDLQVEEM